MCDHWYLLCHRDRYDSVKDGQREVSQLPNYTPDTDDEAEAAEARALNGKTGGAASKSKAGQAGGKRGK
mgnify:CR=1 FL=1